MAKFPNHAYYETFPHCQDTHTNTHTIYMHNIHSHNIYYVHNHIYDHAIMCISTLDKLLSLWQVGKHRLSWPGSRRKFECQLLQRALDIHHVPRLGSSLWLLHAGFLLGPGYGVLYLVLVSEAV